LLAKLKYFSIGQIVEFFLNRGSFVHFCFIKINTNQPDFGVFVMHKSRECIAIGNVYDGCNSYAEII